jgi:hypothetical protein
VAVGLDFESVGDVVESEPAGGIGRCLVAAGDTLMY